MKLQNAIKKAEKVLNTKVVENTYCYQFFYKSYVLELYSYRGLDNEMYFTMPVVRHIKDNNDPQSDYFAGSTYKNLKKALEAIVEKGDRRERECVEVQMMGDIDWVQVAKDNEEFLSKENRNESEEFLRFDLIATQTLHSVGLDPEDRLPYVQKLQEAFRLRNLDSIQTQTVAEAFENEDGEFTFIPFKSTFVDQIDVLFKGRRVAIINGIDGSLLRFVKNEKAEEMSIAQIEWLENYAYRFLDFKGLVPAEDEEEEYDGGIVYEYNKEEEQVILTFEEDEEVKISGREFFELAQGMGFFDNASGFNEEGVTVSFDREIGDVTLSKFRYYNDLILANIFEHGQFTKLALEVRKLKQRDTVPAGSKIEWQDVKLSGFPTVVMGKGGAGKSFLGVHIFRETVIRHIYERTCPAEKIFKITDMKIESFTYQDSTKTSYNEIQHTYLNEKGEKVSVPNRWIDNETFYYDSELKVNQRYLQFLEFEQIMTEGKIKKLQDQ